MPPCAKDDDPADIENTDIDTDGGDLDTDGDVYDSDVQEPLILNFMLWPKNSFLLVVGVAPSGSWWPGGRPAVRGERHQHGARG